MPWEGFDNDYAARKDEGSTGVRGPPKTSGGKKPGGREKMLAGTLASSKRMDAVASSLPPEARLQAQDSPSRVKLKIDPSGHCQVLPSAEENLTATTDLQPAVEASPPPTRPDLPPDNFETPPPEALRLNKLEDFQLKQKIIEEQNRRRKQMLAEALKSRKQQTAQEARKLEQIQEELARIDGSLNTDVRFLRDSIEQASLDFLEAQKRYDRAEKEFIAAKMHMFASLERKELLTDHLCTIIEQNEMRKAKKLEELMEELSLVPCADTLEGPKDALSLSELRVGLDMATLRIPASQPSVHQDQP